MALLRCLWKMNHGGRHRGRSRDETHLVKREKKKRIEDCWVCLRRVLIVRLSTQNEMSYAFMRIKY